MSFRNSQRHHLWDGIPSSEGTWRNVKLNRKRNNHYSRRWRSASGPSAEANLRSDLRGEEQADQGSLETRDASEATRKTSLFSSPPLPLLEKCGPLAKAEKGGRTPTTFRRASRNYEVLRKTSGPGGPRRNTWKNCRHDRSLLRPHRRPMVSIVPLFRRSSDARFGL